MMGLPADTTKLGSIRRTATAFHVCKTPTFLARPTSLCKAHGHPLLHLSENVHDALAHPLAQAHAMHLRCMVGLKGGNSNYGKGTLPGEPRCIT